MRAKAIHRQHRRKHDVGDKATAFGDLVTADHAYSHRAALEGFEGSLDELIIYDVGTGLLAVYPAASKNAEESTKALINFAGDPARYKRIYTDGSRELKRAIRDLGHAAIRHDTSTPGVPQTNGIAESCVKRVIYGARTLLVAAGLPHPYWDLASECFCFLRNTQMVDGDSAWNKAHGKGHFKGKRIPFGALVHFIPSRTIMRSAPQ